MHARTHPHTHTHTYTHTHTLLQVSCCELYQNQVYDLLGTQANIEANTANVGNKDQLTKLWQLMTKVDINNMDHFWDVIARVRQVVYVCVCVCVCVCHTDMGLDPARWQYLREGSSVCVRVCGRRTKLMCA